MEGGDMNTMQSLKREWQQLSCQASDKEEEVNREEMIHKKLRKGAEEVLLNKVRKSSPEIYALETSGSSWGLSVKKDAYDNIEESLLPTKLFGANFNEALHRIWPCLLTDDISSIGICGMGGVGKTTLAKYIKYHLSEKPDYLVLWVTVSQDFSITSLQDKIADVLDIHLSNKDEEEVRADILHGALRKMRRLIVLILDDVWQEFCLDRVGICLYPSFCRLILTTRSLELCHRMQCQRIFDLNTLDTEAAWDLFKYKLGSKTLLHGDAESIAKSIVERCDGLPLSIITVAGSMRGVSDICEWRNALEQLKACSVGHSEMERGVFPILEWSFNRLNECLKNCFLYCSLYPEDHKIKRKELIDLLICEERLPKRNSRSEEFDQGQMILNKLIEVCLLEETKDFEGDGCVKMHDLVRDMGLRITNRNSKLKMSRDVPQFLVKSLGQRYSQVTVEQKEWIEDALSTHSFSSYASPEIEVPPSWSPNCPKLSNLCLPFYSTERFPDSFFFKMYGIKVLNLTGCKGIAELPDSVSDLVNLVVLILGHCQDLRSVPPLGKLKRLRQLDLSWTKIQDLPQGLESLVNLEWLNLDHCWSFIQKIIPKGTFSKLHRLQRLVLPPYGTVQVNDPEVLNQLESFTGCLCFTDFSKISRWPEYYHLYINDDFSSWNESDDCVTLDDDIGEDKQLYFHQCNLGRGSNNPVLVLPSDMKSLVLQDCVSMGIGCLSDAFKNFTSLNDLSSLTIRGLDGIELLMQFSSPAPHDQLVVSSFSPLRNLQELILGNLKNLVGFFFGESEAYLLPLGTFSSLKCLSVYKCHNMKQLFTVQLLQNLENLRVLYVHDCEGLEEIAADDNGVEQGGEGIQLTSSEATTKVILPKLRALRLAQLPELKNICKSSMICDSITEIKMLHCPKLKRLPLFLPTINGLPSLPSAHLKIRGDKEWWESLEWENPCSKKVLDPVFTTREWDFESGC